MNKISYLIVSTIIVSSIVSVFGCTKIEPYRSPYLTTKISKVMKMENENYAIIARSNMDDINTEKNAYSKATMQCNKEGKEMYFMHEYKVDPDTLYFFFKCLN